MPVLPCLISIRQEKRGDTKEAMRMRENGTRGTPQKTNRRLGGIIKPSSEAKTD